MLFKLLLCVSFCAFVSLVAAAGLPAEHQKKYAGLFKPSDLKPLYDRLKEDGIATEDDNPTDMRIFLEPHSAIDETGLSNEQLQLYRYGQTAQPSLLHSAFYSLLLQLGRHVKLFERRDIFVFMMLGMYLLLKRTYSENTAQLACLSIIAIWLSQEYVKYCEESGKFMHVLRLSLVLNEIIESY